MESNHVRDLMEAYSSIYAENEEVEQLDEFSAQAQNFVNDATKGIQSGLEKIGVPINRTQRRTPTEKNQREKINQNQNQSFDLFDIIKGHLLDEGFADTEEAALAIMTNMSEEWREQILDEANRGDEYATSKDHPSLARSKKQKRRNASFDSGATHSKGPRMTSGQQSEIENMPNGGAAEVSRQKTLMRQRYTRNTRGIKPKR